MTTGRAVHLAPATVSGQGLKTHEGAHMKLEKHATRFLEADQKGPRCEARILRIWLIAYGI